jgi:Predicted integral membrane protein (DUF2269)
MNESVATPRRLPSRIRRATLTLHIAASVGLLGTCAAIVAINARAGAADEPALATSAYELLTMFPILFGIPLSFTSLISGIALGLGSKWGVLRYRWVTAKLVLLLSVIVVGALVLGPQTQALADGRGGSEPAIALGSAYDVLALCVATGLSVYKPGRARDRRATRRRTEPVPVRAA